jgi:hypothetical protein
VSEVLERRTISRKTARDGKHEISVDTAARLKALPAPLGVVVDGVADRASILSMPCGCRPEAHEHWFIEAAALRALEAGRQATMSIASDGRTIDIRTESAR